MTQSIEIRQEQDGDEEAIDRVNCRAFRSMDEPNIVRLMRRHWRAYDRRLSITAWCDGWMVGHALFSPARTRLSGRTVDALAVGPVAVVPEHQKQGIGGRLLAAGHERGRELGYELAFLNGHPSYYPRYGYKACFGFAKITIRPDALPAPPQPLAATPVGEDDVRWLAERFEAEWGEVDFGWLWGERLTDWSLPPANAILWRTPDGRRAAYALAMPREKQQKLRVLLADDPQLARDAIATIRPTVIEQHPSGWLASNALDEAWATAEANASPAALAHELRDGVLDETIAVVEAGRRPPGACCWPMPFLLC